MEMKKIITVAMAVAAWFTGIAEIPDSVYRYSGEASVVVSSGGHSPLWLNSNKYGLSSIDSDYGYVRAGFFRDVRYDTRWDWGAGVDIATGYNMTSPYVIQQLYGAVRWRSLQLTAGAWEHTSGFLDVRLSSGDMVLSANARPIPQGMISMPNFEPVPFTKRWLKVKGYVSFGVMTDSRWQHSWVDMELPGARREDHRLYHSKGLFINIGREDKFPLSFQGGLEMAATFGGAVYYRERYAPYDVKLVKMPHGLKEWAKVFIPTGGGSDSGGELRGETTNVTGNHTGEWTAAFNWEDKDRNWSARLYYEHYFDDHSMMFFDHAWKDMLLGVEINLPQNRYVSKFLYEYINTRDQSGSVYWDRTDAIPEQVSGKDDYYNNFLDVGWSHWGQGMGNPMIVSPIYNNPHTLYFYHNRIKGHHIGIEGCPSPQVSYRMLLSLYRSWGTYDYPTSQIRHSFNALWEADWHPVRLKGWSATVGVGLDAGALFGPSFGVNISIKKSGWI